MKLSPRLDNHHASFSTRQVDPTSSVQRRGVVIAAQALTKLFSPGAGIEAGEEASGVRHKVQFLSHQQERGHGRSSLRILPPVNRLGLGIQLDGVNLRLHEARAEVHRATAKDGP